MDKKIDLQEILNNTCRYHNMHGAPILSDIDVKNSMLEFGRQLLELAAENACGTHCTDYVDKKSITNTIKQVK